jgi:RecA/RadA recombinase
MLNLYCIHCSKEEIDLFLYRVASTCAPKPKTALQLLQDTTTLQAMNMSTDQNCWNRLRYLPTGVQSLDDALRGGLRIGTITELAGRAGVGKTQLAMQLCVMTARFRQAAVYMDTENKLSLARLQEIAQQRAAQYYNPNHATRKRTWEDSNNAYFDYTNLSAAAKDTCQQSPSSSQSNENSNGLGQASSPLNMPYPSALQVLDNVTVFSPSTMQELMSSLLEVEALALARNHDENENAQHHQSTFPVRLVIIDSIAAPTKRGGESAPERAASLFQCAQRLKQMADQLQVAILVINQVSLERIPMNHISTMDACSNSIKMRVKAALGTSWHHCVSTRVMMEEPQDHERSSNDPKKQATQYRDMGYHYQTDHTGMARVATIVKSNLVGKQSVEYQITGSGVVDAAVAAAAKPLAS